MSVGFFDNEYGVPSYTSQDVSDLLHYTAGDGYRGLPVTIENSEITIGEGAVITEGRWLTLTSPISAEYNEGFLCASPDIANKTVVLDLYNAKPDNAVCLGFIENYSFTPDESTHKFGDYWQGSAENILTAGEGVTIVGNTISSTGGGGSDVNKEYVDQRDNYVIGLIPEIDVNKAYVDAEVLNAFNRANSAYNTASEAWGIATGANANIQSLNYGVTQVIYPKVNNAYNQANEAYNQAGSAFDYANLAYNEAVNAYDAVNLLNSLAWQGSASSILIAGSGIDITGNTITCTGGSGGVTQEYVDLHDALVKDVADNAYNHANAAYNAVNNIVIPSVDVNKTYVDQRDNYVIGLIPTVDVNKQYVDAADTAINATVASVSAKTSNAFNQANLAYSAAVTAQGAADTAWNTANNAYNHANAAYNAVNSIVIPSVDVNKTYVDTQDNAIKALIPTVDVNKQYVDTATSAMNANISSAYAKANSAYNHASNAYNAVNGINAKIDYPQYGKVNFNNTFGGVGLISSGSGWQAGYMGSMLFNQSKTMSSVIGAIDNNVANAYDTANSAYTHANSAWFNAINAYAKANYVYNKTNEAWNQANNAYGQANDAYSTANLASETAFNSHLEALQAMVLANIAGDRADDAFHLANNAFNAANNAYNLANDAITSIDDIYLDLYAAYNHANNAYNIASDAYNQANAAFQYGYNRKNEVGSAIIAKGSTWDPEYNWQQTISSVLSIETGFNAPQFASGVNTLATTAGGTLINCGFKPEHVVAVVKNTANSIKFTAYASDNLEGKGLSNEWIGNSQIAFPAGTTNNRISNFTDNGFYMARATNAQFTNCMWYAWSNQSGVKPPVGDLDIGLNGVYNVSAINSVNVQVPVEKIGFDPEWYEDSNYGYANYAKSTYYIFEAEYSGFPTEVMNIQYALWSNEAVTGGYVYVGNAISGSTAQYKETIDLPAREFTYVNINGVDPSTWTGSSYLGFNTGGFFTARNLFMAAKVITEPSMMLASSPLLMASAPLTPEQELENERQAELDRINAQIEDLQAYRNTI